MRYNLKARQCIHFFNVFVSYDVIDEKNPFTKRSLKVV